MTHLKVRPVAILVLLGTVVLATLFLIITTHTDSAGAAPEPGMQTPKPSILAPASSETRAALSERAKAWLGELESGVFPPLQGKEVTGIETAQTPFNGEFTLAEIGQYVCVHKEVGPDSIGPNGCANISQVEAGSGYLVMPGCGEDEVVGFMPNGISSLSVDGVEGSVIPVTSNMYVVDLPSVRTVISGTTKDGREISVAIPLDVMPRSCS